MTDASKDNDVVVADGGFFDWCLDMEREVLTELGDEEGLAMNARDRAALHADDVDGPND